MNRALILGCVICVIIMFHQHLPLNLLFTASVAVTSATIYYLLIGVLASVVAQQYPSIEAMLSFFEVPVTRDPQMTPSIKFAIVLLGVLLLVAVVQIGICIRDCFLNESSIPLWSNVLAAFVGYIVMDTINERFLRKIPRQRGRSRTT